MRSHYNKYCKTLSRVIKDAKRQHCCRLAEKANNIKNNLEHNKV
jgi:hypothetical protein